MKRLSVPFFALALALALAAPMPAAAQQPKEPAPLPGARSYYAMLYLGEPALQKELKLSDAQTKKIAEHTAKWIPQVVQGPVGSKMRAEATKAADEALTEILDPGQITRLKQIVLQRLERNAPDVSGMLARIPEVVEELKLTATQKDRIAAGVQMAAVLDDGQKAKWKEMTGPLSFVAGGKGGVGGGGNLITIPASIQYLTQKSVADELNLSAEQAKKVAGIQAQWQKDFPTPGPALADRVKFEARTASTDKEVAELLTAAQSNRLRQIALQQKLTNGREAAVFTLPDVVKELKLTDVQSTKTKSILDETRLAMMPLFLTGEKSEEIAKNIEMHKKKAYAQLLEVLNDGQQTRMHELIGEPFKGQVRPANIIFPGGFAGAAKGKNVTLNTTLASLWISGMFITDKKALHEELHASEAQIKKLTDLRAKSSARISEIGPPATWNVQYETLRAQLAKDNETALVEILKPHQLTRFKQLVLQHYQNVARSLPTQAVPVLGRFVEVREGLMLTKDQQDRIQKGEVLTKLLNEKQQAKWQEMVGEPFAKVAALSLPPGGAQGFGGIGGIGGGGGPLASSLVQYLGEKSVQEELKLTQEQIAKLPELTRTWAELIKDVPITGFQSEDEFNERFAEPRKKLEKAIADVLGAKQIDRLRQIELQQTRKSGRLGVTGLGDLLALDKVRKGLDLREDQSKKITAITADAYKTELLFFREFSSSGGGFASPSDGYYTKTMESFNKIVDKQLNAELAPNQHDSLNAILGPPFEGEIRRFGGGGGIGIPGFIGGGIGAPGIGKGAKGGAIQPGVPASPAPVILGVTTAPADAYFGGVLIRAVTENALAAKAGLKPGDRILSVGGKAVDTLTPLRTILTSYKGGDKAEIVFERDGKHEKVQIEFAPVAPAPAANRESQNRFLGEWLNPNGKGGILRLEITKKDNDWQIETWVSFSKAEKSGGKFKLHLLGDNISSTDLPYGFASLESTALGSRYLTLKLNKDELVVDVYRMFTPERANGRANFHKVERLNRK